LKSQNFHQPNKAKMLRSMLMSFLADLDFCPLTHRTWKELWMIQDDILHSECKA
jgi:hypothetical protein